VGHTPGPWSIDGIGLVVAPEPAERGEYKAIAQVRYNARANAPLIAAAPELFALLQAIDDMWSDDGDGARADPIDARSGQVREIWQQMRDTLAKARGEA
jgi:hypothetical protein